MKIFLEIEPDKTWANPIQVAKSLINASEIIEHNDLFSTLSIGSDKSVVPMFGNDELLQIAEYLQVYCKYNREDENNE